MSKDVRAKTGKGRHVSSQSKEIIFNVSVYFENEAKVPSNIPVNAFVRKTEEATGVSESTIRRIRQQGGKFTSPLKAKQRKSQKDLDDFDLCVIRNKIHEFYTVRRQFPTLKALHKSLKDDIAYSGGKETLRKCMKKLGFQWKRSKSNRQVLIEKYNIVNLRCQFLRDIRKYHEEGLNIVYLDETWIDTSYTPKYCWQGPSEHGVLAPLNRGQRLIVVHAGGAKGFVPGALLIYKAASSSGDYHNEMNGDMFKKWFCEKLLLNLQEKTVIVMDNASYHSVHSTRNPTSNTKKADIQQWLRDHNIPFDNNLLRPQLLALAKMHKQPPDFMIDKIAKDEGHIILRLPPYHPDLNPIEMVWSQVKGIVAQKNTTCRVNDVMQLANDAFQQITVQDWENHCRHVRTIEERYRQNDIVIDNAIDDVIIDLADDSESSGDDSADDSFSEDDSSEDSN